MPVAILKNKEEFLYQQVVTLIREMKKEGTIRAGVSLGSLS